MTKKKKEWTKCRHEGCNKDSTMMRRNRKDPSRMDHYCSAHWKTDVENKNPKAYQDRVSKSKPKKRRIKK